jgi:hypothetical protein
VSAYPGPGREFDADVAYTGHERVDDALTGLAAVTDASPAEQIQALTDAHQILVETLDSIGDI